MIIKNIYKDDEIREVSITLRSGKEIIFCPEENETNFMTIYNEERNTTEKRTFSSSKETKPDTLTATKSQ